MSLERCQRADFVRAHQTALTDDIRRQDRCQPPIDAPLCHTRCSAEGQAVTLCNSRDGGKGPMQGDA